METHILEFCKCLQTPHTIDDGIIYIRILCYCGRHSIKSIDTKRKEIEIATIWYDSKPENTDHVGKQYNSIDNKITKTIYYISGSCEDVYLFLKKHSCLNSDLHRLLLYEIEQLFEAIS